MRKFHLLVLVMVLLAGCVPVSMAQSITPDIEEPWDGLWIDMSMGPDLVDWYNQTARPGDIARADHVSMIDLLDQIQVGRKLVVFKNAADAQQLVPRLVGKMDVIGYNIEHGPSNRPEEQADPVGSIRKMRELADAYDLELAVGPDHDFALTAGPAMAPYADIFVLQVQRVQTEPDTVRQFVLPLVAQLREANPDLAISIQVRTEGDVVAIADLIASMEADLDGVSILTSPETVPIAEALVTELRPEAPESPTPPAPLAPAVPGESAVQPSVAVLPTPTARRTNQATATPVSQPSIAAGSAPETDAVRNWLLAAGIVAFGVLISGLVTTAVLYSYQNSRFR